MLNKNDKYVNKYTGWRRGINLKFGLTILICFAIFVTLSEGHYISDIDSINLQNKNQPKEIVLMDSTEQNYENDYCLTSECNNTTTRVLKYMDREIDPCDNFYKFACGNFHYYVEFSEYFVIQEDQNSIIQDKIKKYMKSILEEKYTSTEPKYVRLIKTFYQNCIRATEINKQNVELVSDLLNTLGGWPLLIGNSSSHDNFQWEKFGSELENGVFWENSFLSTNVYQDKENKSNQALYIQQPSDFSPISEYGHDLVIHTLQYFGADEFKVEEDIKQMMYIADRLSNISVPEEERTYHTIRMTIKEISGNYSNISWKDYFNTYLKPFETIKDDDVVFIRDVKYFEQFNNLIKHFSKRDQANYLIWQVVESFLGKTSQYVGSIVSKKRKFQKCYKHLEKLFDITFGMMYIRKYFNAKSIASIVDEMTTNIFQQFNNILEESNWLDKKTKNKALEKLSSVFLAHPKIYESSSDKEIDEYYTNLEITPGDFLQSFVEINKFNNYKEKYDFRKPLNFSSWAFLMNPLTVNANYNMYNNSIAISPGIMQGIYVNQTRPQYMNYGSLGFLIAHELTHAFDNDCRKYDREGYLNDWWEPESDKEFLTKAECLIHQYGNYTVEQIKENIKGQKTLSENISDNGGVKVAYLAYEEYMRTHSPDLLLPGVNFTQRQLFWISFAQKLCSTIDENGLEYLIFEDTHSLNEFRVIGSVVNRPEFARDFQCAIGTKMNPKNKCSVW